MSSSYPRLCNFKGDAITHRSLNSIETCDTLQNVWGFNENSIQNPAERAERPRRLLPNTPKRVSSVWFPDKEWEELAGPSNSRDRYPSCLMDSRCLSPDFDCHAKHIRKFRAMQQVKNKMFEKPETPSSSSSTDSWRFGYGPSQRSTPLPPYSRFKQENVGGLAFSQEPAQSYDRTEFPPGRRHLSVSTGCRPEDEFYCYSDSSSTDDSDDKKEDSNALHRESVSITKPLSIKTQEAEENKGSEATAAGFTFLSKRSKKSLRSYRHSISTSFNKLMRWFKPPISRGGHISRETHSCTNTPLRSLSQFEAKPNRARQRFASPASSTSTTSSSPPVGYKSNSSKQNKQKSILRPPIHYVNMKGMSGLYSRVPKYAGSCPGAMQRLA